MAQKIPSNPSQVVQLTPRTRIKTSLFVAFAKIFGFWRYPARMAATSFDEMTMKDIYYWVYKSANPILNPEKGMRWRKVVKTDPSEVTLPENFEKHSAITFGAGGDLLQSAGLTHSKDILFRNVSDLLFEKDISYANFESPVTNQALQDEIISDRGPPVECCSREQFDVLASHQGQYFTVLNTANNHTFDMGIEGIETMLQAFSEEEILDTGTNRTIDEHGKGKFLTFNGIKLGFVSTSFGLNGRQLPDQEAYRVNVSRLLSKIHAPDISLLKSQINDCKDNGCDFIITSLHWGFEFEFFPRQRQIDIARELVEYGADAIIGHHPHVIQPVEYYRTNRDSDRVAIIAYSLGSLTWGFSAPHLVLSNILNISIAKGQKDGKSATYIESSKSNPVFRSYTWENGQKITRIEKLEDHLRGSNRQHKPSYISAIKKYADIVLQ